MAIDESNNTEMPSFPRRRRLRRRVRSEGDLSVAAASGTEVIARAHLRHRHGPSPGGNDASKGAACEQGGLAGRRRHGWQ